MRKIDTVIQEIDEILKKPKGQNSGRTDRIRELVKEAKAIRAYPKWKKVRDWIMRYK
jgi:hypothetical protein